MTGPEFVDLVLEYVGSGLTRPKAYIYINNAINQILAGRHELLRVRPDPFLTTASADYDYTASSSIYSSVGGAKGSLVGDIKDVGGIYSFNNDRRIFAYNDEDVVSEHPYWAENHMANADVFAPMDVTQSKEPSNSDCEIIWWEDNDPGVTTVDWRVICWTWPTQFTSESVALAIPADFQDTLLLFKVLIRLGVRQYGGITLDAKTMHDLEMQFAIKYSNRAKVKKRGRECREV